MASGPETLNVEKVSFPCQRQTFLLRSSWCFPATKTTETASDFALKKKTPANSVDSEASKVAHSDSWRQKRRRHVDAICLESASVAFARFRSHLISALESHAPLLAVSFPTLPIASSTGRWSKAWKTATTRNQLPGVSIPGGCSWRFFRYSRASKQHGTFVTPGIHPTTSKSTPKASNNQRYSQVLQTLHGQKPDKVDWCTSNVD